MKYINLGNSDIKVSKLGLGCMGMTHAYGAPSDENEMIKMIHSAVDMGITFFDTAECYVGTGADGQPVYNEENDVWTCGFERSFNTNVDLDNINTVLNVVQSHSSEVQNSAQEMAEREYERAENEEMLDADKIYDNLSYYSEIVDTTE